MKDIKIRVFEIVGGEAAVSSEDGETVYKRISTALESDVHVTLDFNNIKLITSSFLNTAIGQLYHKYESPFLRKHLGVANMEKEDMELLKRVVERAKEYFKDRKRMVGALKAAMKNE